MSCSKTRDFDTVEEYLAWTRHPEPLERKRAAKALCPCTVRKIIFAFSFDLS